VTAAADIHECKVTGSNRPWSDLRFSTCVIAASAAGGCA